MLFNYLLLTAGRKETEPPGIFYVMLNCCKYGNVIISREITRTL